MTTNTIFKQFVNILFLTALIAVGSKDGFADLCQGVLQTVRRDVWREQFDRTIEMWGLGTTGLGSVLYVLARNCRFQLRRVISFTFASSVGKMASMAASCDVSAIPRRVLICSRVITVIKTA